MYYCPYLIDEKAKPNKTPGSEPFAQSRLERPWHAGHTASVGRGRTADSLADFLICSFPLRLFLSLDSKYFLGIWDVSDTDWGLQTQQ